MRQKSVIKALFLAIILTGAFLLLRAGVSGTKASPKKESMDDCTKNSNEATPKMGFESLPQQFFSSF